jgi:hypothetical protein
MRSSISAQSWASGAAGAGVDLHEAVVAVRLARQEAFGFAARGLGGEGLEVGHGGVGGAGVALGLGQLDQFHRVGDGLLQPAHALDLVGEAAALAHDAAGGLGVGPERRVLGAGVQLVELTDGGIPVKDASSAEPPIR